MSERSNKKVITKESRVIKLMRERKGLSMRDAAARSGLSMSSINFIENGRQSLLPRHLDVLLPAYGETLESFLNEVKKEEMPMSFAHHRCLEIIPLVPDEIASALHRILEKIQPENFYKGE